MTARPRNTEPIPPPAARSAEQALSPHLELMKKTARRGTDRQMAVTGMLMLWLGDDINAAVNGALAAHGVSENKLDILMLFDLAERGLLEVEALTPSFISAYFGVTRSSVTGLIDWLEQRELLARKAREEDRRSLRLELTQQGRDLLHGAMPDFWHVCADIVSPLSATEREALHLSLSKIWLHQKQKK